MFRFGRIAGLIAVVFLCAAFTSTDIEFKSLRVAGDSDGAEIPAKMGRPEGTGPFPAVVMLPTCGGLSREMYEDWAGVLAKAGYVSIALENVKSRGMKHCLTRGPRGRPFDSWIGDAYGALDYLSRQAFVDTKRVALMGFSNGGIIISNFMARDLATSAGHRFKAMISVYAHCNGNRMPGGPPVAGNPTLPWLILNGSEERIQMKGPCSQMKDRPNVTFMLIEGAHHAWDGTRFTEPREDPAGNVMIYSEDATRKSHAIVLDFLAKHLK